MLFGDGPKRIPNTVVREGGGVGWMLNPIPMPNFVGSDCDDMEGKPCHGCPCGSGYPGGNTDESFPNPFGKDLMGKNTAIVDLVKVPRVPPGEYVVGFRWDCETSSQVCRAVTAVVTGAPGGARSPHTLTPLAFAPPRRDPDALPPPCVAAGFTGVIALTASTALTAVIALGLRSGRLAETSRSSSFVPKKSKGMRLLCGPFGHATWEGVQHSTAPPPRAVDVLPSMNSLHLSIWPPSLVEEWPVSYL